MAISAVAATLVTADAASANATSKTATSGSAFIVGGAAWTGSSVPGSWTVTRTGDTYTIDAQGVSSTGSGNRHRNGIASAPNVGTSANTLTISVTNGGSIDGWILELAGLPTTSIRDATSPATNVGIDTTAETNSLTNATADAIFVGVLGNESGLSSVTVTEPSGYTITVGGTTMKRTNGSTDQAGGMAYKIVAATGAETPTWTTTADTWSTNIAVYKAAAGGGGSQTVNPGFISAGSQVFAPTLNQIIHPGFISAGSTVYAPTFSPGNVNVTPGFISAGSQVFAPTFGASGSLNPSLVAATSQVYAPTFNSVYTVAPGFISGASQVYAPTFVPGAVTVAAGFISSNQQVYAPTLSVVSPQSVTAAFITATSQVYQPIARSCSGTPDMTMLGAATPVAVVQLQLAGTTSDPQLSAVSPSQPAQLDPACF